MRAIPTLKISISGVRGVIGDSLTPSLLTRFAQAFGTHTGPGTIVIGRDPRTSGEMVKHAVIAGILSSGSRVVDIGVCPVPTVQLQVRQRIIGSYRRVLQSSAGKARQQSRFIMAPTAEK